MTCSCPCTYNIIFYNIIFVTRAAAGGALSSSGLSAGAASAIAIFVILVVGVLAYGVYFMYRRRQFRESIRETVYDQSSKTAPTKTPIRQVRPTHAACNLCLRKHFSFE